MHFFCFWQLELSCQQENRKNGIAMIQKTDAWCLSISLLHIFNVISIWHQYWNALFEIRVAKPAVAQATYHYIGTGSQGKAKWLLQMCVEGNRRLHFDLGFGKLFVTLSNQEWEAPEQKVLEVISRKVCNRLGWSRRAETIQHTSYILIVRYRASHFWKSLSRMPFRKRGSYLQCIFIGSEKRMQKWNSSIGNCTWHQWLIWTDFVDMWFQSKWPPSQQRWPPG